MDDVEGGKTQLRDETDDESLSGEGRPSVIEFEKKMSEKKVLTTGNAKRLLPRQNRPEDTVLAWLIGGSRTKLFVNKVRERNLHLWLSLGFYAAAMITPFVFVDFIPREFGFLCLIVGLPSLVYHCLTVNRFVLSIQVRSFEFWYLQVFSLIGFVSLFDLLEYDSRVAVAFGWFAVNFTFEIMDSGIDIPVAKLGYSFTFAMCYQIGLPLLISYEYITVRNRNINIVLPGATFGFELSTFSLFSSAMITLFVFTCRWMTISLLYPKLYVTIQARIPRMKYYRREKSSSSIETAE